MVMSERTMFTCDNCGITKQGRGSGQPPEGWLPDLAVRLPSEQSCVHARDDGVQYAMRLRDHCSLKCWLELRRKELVDIEREKGKA
jgi:hypothetical protein